MAASAIPDRASDTDEQDALRIAEAIRLNVQALAMENPASASGHVSISLGIATRTGKTENERSLVGEADRALYEAKDQGAASLRCRLPARAWAKPVRLR